MSTTRAHGLPFPNSPGDGHSFPMRSMNESQNPLLANEEPWEDNEDENRGKEARKEAFLHPAEQALIKNMLMQPM